MAETNENKPVAIQVSGVKKMYRLGQIGGGTLQADLQSWFARVRGKEDPNTKIGEGERIKGQTFMALNGIDLTIYQGYYLDGKDFESTDQLAVDDAVIVYGNLTLYNSTLSNSTFNNIRIYCTLYQVRYLT